jgi:predicted O-methyltransferase YrrM
MLARGAKKRGAAQKTREFAALLSLLRQRELGVVVEIGTLHGGTLWAWCKLARPDGLIISIDLPGGSFGGGYGNDVTSALKSYAKRSQTVVLIRDDSHQERTRAALENALDGESVDLLFIDGDHTYEGVRCDFNMYSQFVRPGGLIVLHDILAHPGDPDCQVDLLWRDLRADRQCIEFVDPGDVRSRGQWGGIGVVFTEL